MTDYLPRTVRVFVRVGDDGPHMAATGETMSWGNKAGGQYVDANFSRGVVQVIKAAVEAGDNERAIEAASAYIKDFMQ